MINLIKYIKEIENAHKSLMYYEFKIGEILGKIYCLLQQIVDCDWSIEIQKHKKEIDRLNNELLFLKKKSENEIHHSELLEKDNLKLKKQLMENKFYCNLIKTNDLLRETLRFDWRYEVEEKFEKLKEKLKEIESE